MSADRLSFRKRQLAARLQILREVGIPHLVRERRLRARYARATAELTPGVFEAMWRDAATELGAEMRRLTPGMLEFRLGAATAHVGNLMTTRFADRLSGELAADKTLTYRLLADAGLPLPEHVVVNAGDIDGATAFLAEAGTPVVVKPARGAGGAGVVGHVQTPAQLKLALTSTGRYCPSVVVERQIDGDSYRLLLLDGKLLDVVRRDLPRIAGDGTSTIETLVFREYERRIAAGADPHGFKPLDIDLDCLFTLAFGGYGLDSIVPAGVSVVFRTATNFSGPERSSSVTGSVNDGVIASARTAAARLGMRLAGVDVVTTDATRPLAETGGVLLEVNAPGLHHHYNLADRTSATRVAVPILAALLDEGRPMLPDGRA